MNLIWLILCCIVPLSYGIDRTKLWKIQQPMKGVQLPKLLGQWYVTYQFTSNSWAGTQEFKDYEIFLSTTTPKGMMAIKTFRQNGICNTIVSKSKHLFPPGAFLHREILGSQIEGMEVVLSTDYKTYMIMAGCDRITITGDSCEDGYLNIRTRMPHPNKFVIQQINEVLMKHYGATVDHIQTVIHNKPCKKQSVVCPNGKWW
ncbi:hypothetical protein ACF0H5_009534 [Mactra antiquata]